MVLFFFFSSRRRHTRCGRDWSSDVCSSDLIDWRSGSDNLARNHGVLIERINRTEPVITVRNDYFGMLLISHEEKRRELAAVSDLFQVLFYMEIADSKQRQCRCSKDVFGLEAGHLSAFQLFDKPRGGFLVIEQFQV